VKAAAGGSLRFRLKARLRRGAESCGCGDAMGEGRGLARGGAVSPQTSEPFRTGSRYRCRSMHVYAACHLAILMTGCFRTQAVPHACRPCAFEAVRLVIRSGTRTLEKGVLGCCRNFLNASGTYNRRPVTTSNSYIVHSR